MRKAAQACPGYGPRQVIDQIKVCEFFIRGSKHRERDGSTMPNSEGFGTL